MAIVSNCACVFSRCNLNPRSIDVLISSNNYFSPTNMSRRHGLTWEGQKDDEYLSAFIVTGDKDMIPLLELEMVEGEEKVRNFERGDTDAYIINEAAMDQLNWDTFDGKYFSIFGDDRPGEVIGVCKNFNFRSLHHEIGPCVIILSEYGRQISLKVQSDDYMNTIADVKRIYAQIFGRLILI